MFSVTLLIIGNIGNLGRRPSRRFCKLIANSVNRGRLRGRRNRPGVLYLLTMRYWTAVVTRRGQERRAAANVERLGFPFYMPMLAVENKTRGTLMFPGYLLVQIDTRSSWEVLASTRGVARLFMCDVLPVRVPNAEIKRLWDLEQGDGLVHLPERFSPGDRVRVGEGGGSWSGISGIYQGATQNERCLVLLQILGKDIVTAVSARSLEAA